MGNDVHWFDCHTRAICTFPYSIRNENTDLEESHYAP